MSYLSYKTIVGAIQGEEGAIEEVLQEYDAYITELATFQIKGMDGHKRTIVSEDAKQELRESWVLSLRHMHLEKAISGVGAKPISVEA